MAATRYMKDQLDWYGKNLDKIQKGVLQDIHDFDDAMSAHRPVPSEAESSSIKFGLRFANIRSTITEFEQTLGAKKKLTPAEGKLLDQLAKLKGQCEVIEKLRSLYGDCITSKEDAHWATNPDQGLQRIRAKLDIILNNAPIRQDW